MVVVSSGLSSKTDHELKSSLVRIIATTLNRKALKYDGVSESSRDYNKPSPYNKSSGDEYKHRDSEHDEEPLLAAALNVSVHRN